MDKTFVTNIYELKDSILTFSESSDYWKKEATKAHPKYFVHFENDNIHYFGLSKFCAFNKINLVEYTSKFRYTTNGYTTQKHISKITGKDWIAINEIDPKIQQAFINWFFSFFSNKYDLKEISIISIDFPAEIKTKSKRKTQISPEELKRRLENQLKIGQVGEDIAYHYEIFRLANLNITKPEKYVEHVSKYDSAAGFDIKSINSCKDKSIRYIEIKSSLKKDQNFFITETEYSTLCELRKQAFIYLVHVIDIENKKGRVFLEVNDPIEVIEKKGVLKPILYEVTLNKYFTNI